MSGYCGPTPLQNSLMPPPVPVLSTFGVLNLPARPNCSATVVVNGYTVEEPTMLMESRADWACAVALRAQTMLAASEEIEDICGSLVLPPVVTGGNL